MTHRGLHTTPSNHQDDQAGPRAPHRRLVTSLETPSASVAGKCEVWNSPCHWAATNAAALRLRERLKCAVEVFFRIGSIGVHPTSTRLLPKKNLGTSLVSRLLGGPRRGALSRHAFC
jgi:hypothetical protein